MATDRKHILLLPAVVALFLVVLWYVPHIPASIYQRLQEGSGFLVVNLAHLLGLSASYNPANHYYAVAGFEMRLIEECVALHYHAILTLAILLFPKQSWLRKVVALVCCNAALLFFNTLRMVFLGVLGNASPELFYPVHDYIWQIAFAILTFFLAIAWIDDPGKQRRTRCGLLLYCLAFSGVFALGMSFIKLYYLTAVTWIADKLMVLTVVGNDWGMRWWLASKKQFVVVRLFGEKILYAFPGGQEHTVSLWQDMLTIVLFWGFCAAGFVWATSFRGQLSRVDIFKGFTIGSFVLVAVHILTVATLGWTLTADTSMAMSKNFLWLSRGLSVLLPVAFWLMIWKRPDRNRDGVVIGPSGVLEV